jgi:hypothetical protein
MSEENKNESSNYEQYTTCKCGENRHPRVKVSLGEKLEQLAAALEQRAGFLSASDQEVLNTLNPLIKIFTQDQINELMQTIKEQIASGNSFKVTVQDPSSGTFVTLDLKPQTRGADYHKMTHEEWKIRGEYLKEVLSSMNPEDWPEPMADSRDLPILKSVMPQLITESMKDKGTNNE